MSEKLKDLVRKHALEVKPDGEYFTLKSGASRAIISTAAISTLHQRVCTAS